MREIKFRAWDKENKVWIGDKHLEYLCVNDSVVVLVKYKPNNQGGYSPESCRQLTNPEVDNLEIVQFTGLKDKNGKEIYEGDIIQGDYENKIERGTVYWNTETAGFDIDDSTWRSCENLECSEKYYEVIGNIYENPETTERKTNEK